MKVNCQNIIQNCIFCILIALFLFPYHSAVSAQQPSGKITLPSDGQKVSGPFYVKGELSSIADSNSIWLVVQVGNLLWPKVDIKVNNSTFLKSIEEGGESGKIFFVQLLMVNSEGVAEIEAWQEKCENSGKWPGMDQISGSKILGIVQLEIK